MNASSDAQLKLALEKFRSGELDAAMAAIESVLSSSPAHGEALHLGAATALRNGRPDLACGLASRAVSAETGNCTYRFTLAQVLSTLKRHDEAIGELREILQREPAFQMAHIQIWNIMKTLGRRHELTDLVKARLALMAAAPHTQVKVPIADTTLCCIDCSSHVPAVRALRLCTAGCEFSRAILFTDRAIDIRPIETVLIEPLRSLQGYSEFVMKQLLRYIETKYVLIVQWDGYVVNPGAWSAEFQQYDYIGARLPFLPAGRSVGNGGFSLRSRALLEILQNPRFEVLHPEDLAICQKYRDILEQEYGIRFAPEAVADRFSFELAEPAGPTFGFHGPRNITRFVDDEAIRLLQAT
jgi:Protein of unknown function (DUF5672)